MGSEAGSVAGSVAGLGVVESVKERGSATTDAAELLYRQPQAGAKPFSSNTPSNRAELR